MKHQEIDFIEIEAAEHMGELHDALKDSGYTDHQLEMYLVRLLFCLFADDSGIFDEKKLFFKYINDRTNIDGSDLALHLGQIFDTLNKPKESRLKNIDETLNKFPYIDGNIFEERLETAAFDSVMRKTLLKCYTLDWSKIKPEIFGAMFQSVKDKEGRRELGEHYTSETNILKIIHPLFLDALWKEFEKIRKMKSDARIQQLLLFHDKLHKLKFLDPACGCGNFLVVSYRELRLLEIEVLYEYLQLQKILDLEIMSRVNVDQFYGIEIEEFPARIAQTALWLMDHLMNMKASERFGKYYVRIPLTASPSIIIGNALTTNWESVVPKTELSYILGNPPFLGSRIMNKRQKSEVQKTFVNLKNWGELDYVCCWYKTAAEYMQDTEIECALVSTNSICQGLQVPILWPDLVNKYKIKINFAHQTFKWSNEARGKAVVYCVIIGFSLEDKTNKKIYQYANVSGEPMETSVKRINMYLIDGENIFVSSRTKPLCDVPEMNFGNMPADGGELLFTDEEKRLFLTDEPEARKYLRYFISAREFIHNTNRWCLWLTDIEPSELKKLKLVYERIKKVKVIREKSARPFLADVPHLFAQITQPKGQDYILVPRVSSEARKYIPMGFFSHKTVVSDTCLIIPKGTLYHFGVLNSLMHMTWTRYVCGRLKSDYRYSKDIVYNNFPWPNSTEKQIEAIKQAAQKILDARSEFPNSSLADLYDPIAMPKELLKAHQKLDKAVDAAYSPATDRQRSFGSESERITFLFELYQKLSGELFVEEKKRGKGRRV